MSNYKYGLVSVSFRGSSPAEIIGAVKEAGLTCIEWGSDVHAPKDDIKRLEEIAALQKEAGIECCSYGTYFRLGINDNSEIREYAKAAKILGTNIMRVWCKDKNSEDFTEEEAESFFEVCRDAAKIAEECGVILCCECHNDTYTNRKEGFARLFEAVKSPAFKMYWQPNQYRTFEENIKYAGMLSGVSEHLHVFNWEGDEKFPLADAIDTWKAYMECFSGDKALLLEFMPDNRIESLKTEAEAMYKI